MSTPSIVALVLIVVLLALLGTVIGVAAWMQGHGVTVRWSIEDGLLTLVGPKLLAIPSVLHIPVHAITTAQIVEEPLTIKRGIRIGGTSLPGLKLGTFGVSTERSWWAATRDRRAVKLELSGRRYAFAVVTVADPDQFIAAVRAQTTA